MCVCGCSVCVRVCSVCEELKLCPHRRLVVSTEEGVVEDTKHEVVVTGEVSGLKVKLRLLLLGVGNCQAHQNTKWLKFLLDNSGTSE